MEIESTLRHAFETYCAIVEMREEMEEYTYSQQATNKPSDFIRAIRALENAEKTFAPFLAEYIRCTGRG